MSIKRDIVQGTLILTVAGVLTRLLGLYNRVFLANVMSAAQLGIYQLIFPLLSVSLSICCHGIQSALSKFVSWQSAKGNMKNIHWTMRIGMGIAFLVSVVLCVIVYVFARPLATYILRETACTKCLKILAFVMPFSTLHECVLGYFLGMQKAMVPAISQLLEQIVRVATIYVLAMTCYFWSGADASMAVYGMLAGEAVSCIFTLVIYKISIYRAEKKTSDTKEMHFKKIAVQLLGYAYPMTVNRLALTLLQSSEAVLMPAMLKIYYHDAMTALEIYGVVSAMVFPFIMFPATVTNALATMLMPAVSRASAKKDFSMIQNTISKSIHYCLLIGILSLAIFFVYGRMLGMVVFKNELAGKLLKIFAFLCPFIYISSSLAGTLNGLGKVRITLRNSMVSLALRILFIVIAVPIAGIKGYLWGQLAGYIVIALLNGYSVMKFAQMTVDPWKTLVFPMAFVSAGALISLGIYRYLLYNACLPPLILLGISCLCMALVYGISLVFTGIVSVRA